MKKNMIFVALLLGLGIAMAVGPATWITASAEGKFDAVAASGDNTEGGNVTNLNVESNQSTEKWAGYWGNVSGRLLLSPQDDGTQVFYSWAWTPASGGDVCAVAASSGFDWASVVIASPGAVNSAWSLGMSVDNATNTLTQNCAANVAGTAVSGTAGRYTGGLTVFQTCAINDGGATKSDFAFCTNMSNAGTLFNGQVGNYEVLVPANPAPATTETYYFWLELE
jgi:hypothetical protein